MWNIFKMNNTDTRTTTIKSFENIFFWCSNCCLWTIKCSAQSNGGSAANDQKKTYNQLEFRHPIIHILNLATWTEIVLLFYENIQNFNLNLDCLSTLRSFWKTFWAKRYVKSKIVFSPQLERNTKYDWPMYDPYFRSCKCRLRILGENLEITKNIYKKTIDKSVPSFDSKKW